MRRRSPGSRRWSPHWPEAIRPDQLGDPALAKQVIAARLALLEALDLGELA